MHLLTNICLKVGKLGENQFLRGYYAYRESAPGTRASNLESALQDAYKRKTQTRKRAMERKTGKLHRLGRKSVRNSLCELGKILGSGN